MRKYRSCSVPEPENCAGLTQKALPVNPCTPVDPSPIYANAIAKAPVLLSMMDMKVMLTNIIEMPEGAMAPTVLDRAIVDMNMTVMPEANMLFIKGLVRTSMAYTVPDCVDEDTLTGNLKHMSMDCPFECSTEIDFNMCSPSEPEPRFTLRTAYRDPCYPCDGNLYNPGHQMTLDKLNTPMVAELLDSKIMATMKAEPELYAPYTPCDVTNGVGLDNDDYGCTLREDMVIEMKIGVYQDKFVKMG